MAEEESTRDKADNGFNILGLGLPTLEGWWRGGLLGSGRSATLPKGGRVVNAAMLEKFAGVDGGGKAGVVNGAPNGGGVNALGVLGTLGGAYGMFTGISDAVNGFCDGDAAKGTMGVVNAALGGISTLGGLANMANIGLAAGTGTFATMQNVVHGMTSMGGAGLGGGGLAGNVLEASTWVGKGAGAAGVGTALSTVASVAGAGIAGYNLGEYGNKHAAESGVLGKRADGTNLNVTDWMWNKGSAADDKVTDFIGGEKGSLRAGVGGVLGTIANGVVQAGAGVVGTGWSALDGLVGAGVGAGFDAVEGVRDWSANKHFDPIRGVSDGVRDLHKWFQPQPVDPATPRPVEPPSRSLSDGFRDLHNWFQPQPVKPVTPRPAGEQ